MVPKNNNSVPHATSVCTWLRNTSPKMDENPRYKFQFQVQCILCGYPRYVELQQLCLRDMKRHYGYIFGGFLIHPRRFEHMMGLFFEDSFTVPNLCSLIVEYAELNVSKELAVSWGDNIKVMSYEPLDNVLWYMAQIGRATSSDLYL